MKPLVARGYSGRARCHPCPPQSAAPAGGVTGSQFKHSHQPVDGTTTVRCPHPCFTSAGVGPCVAGDTAAVAASPASPTMSAKSHAQAAYGTRPVAAASLACADEPTGCGWDPSPYLPARVAAERRPLPATAATVPKGPLLHARAAVETASASSAGATALTCTDEATGCGWDPSPYLPAQPGSSSARWWAAAALVGVALLLLLTLVRRALPRSRALRPHSPAHFPSRADSAAAHHAPDWARRTPRRRFSLQRRQRPDAAKAGAALGRALAHWRLLPAAAAATSGLPARCCAHDAQSRAAAADATSACDADSAKSCVAPPQCEACVSAFAAEVAAALGDQWCDDGVRFQRALVAAALGASDAVTSAVSSARACEEEEDGSISTAEEAGPSGRASVQHRGTVAVHAGGALVAAANSDAVNGIAETLQLDPAALALVQARARAFRTQPTHCVGNRGTRPAATGLRRCALLRMRRAHILPRSRRPSCCCTPKVTA